MFDFSAYPERVALRPFFLAGEPTSALDPKATVDVWRSGGYKWLARCPTDPRGKPPLR